MPTKTKAIDMLDPSRLLTGKQLELMGGDTNVADLTLQIERGIGIDIATAITDISADRTIIGASTLTVSVDDDLERTIQRSGVLGHHVDINVDGLWWTLVAVKKNARAIDLVFEEREVNLLRRYNSPIFANRSKVSRAQFVLRMINEVKETKLKYMIPELNVNEAPSPFQPDEILVNGNGDPINPGGSLLDANQRAASRGRGIRPGANLKIKGAVATREQIHNADIILETGEGMNAPRELLIASIMVAIHESSIINYKGDPYDPSHNDSHGVFQQRPSQGWPASRDVATDAAAFFQRGLDYMSLNPQNARNIGNLCVAIQSAGTASSFMLYYDEAGKFVEAYDHSPSATENKAANASSGVASNTNIFMRGQVTKVGGMTGAFLLKKETSWTCMNRLAQEVNWRCFCVSGVIYFVSDRWLFRSKPFLSISEDSDGIDWIDYDYDEGKNKATVRVSCQMERWSAPPGSTVMIEDQGIIDGKYLVTDVQRSLYSPDAVIQLEKPLPVLPEPVALGGIPAGFMGAGGGGTDGSGRRNSKPPSRQSNTDIAHASETQQLVCRYAIKQLGVRYQWGAEKAGVAFDCSGLSQAAWAAASISIPRVAQAQYDFGRKLRSNEKLEPGDLIFFGSSITSIEHVGIFIGDGQMIDAPHSGASVRVDKGFMDWTNPPYVGATRPHEDS